MKLQEHEKRIDAEFLDACFSNFLRDIETASSVLKVKIDGCYPAVFYPLGDGYEKSNYLINALEDIEKYFNDLRESYNRITDTYEN